jgi:hypothetical protein
LVFIMVISGIIDSILMLADQPHWFLLSTNGDSIATVYGGYELFMEGIAPGGGFGGGGGRGLFQFESPDISLMILSMVIYLVVGFGFSIWISGRRQLT